MNKKQQYWYRESQAFPVERKTERKTKRDREKREDRREREKRDSVWICCCSRPH